MADPAGNGHGTSQPAPSRQDSAIQKAGESPDTDPGVDHGDTSPYKRIPSIREYLKIRLRSSWLTGTGGWMYTAATKYMLGVRLSFDGLVVDPCIPSDWKEFEVARQWRGATYNIKVVNPQGVQKGVKEYFVKWQACQRRIAAAVGRFGK